MRRTVLVLGLSVAAAAPSLGAAQSKTRITLAVSPSAVNFERAGANLGAFVAQARISRDITAQAGVEVTAFSLMPTGAVSIMAGCLPDATCPSTETPSQVNGGFASAYLDIGETPLRLSTGYGRVHAVGGAGLEARNSGAYQLGLEWSPRRRAGLQLSAGVRALHLMDSILGARQLLLPGVGVTF